MILVLVTHNLVGNLWAPQWAYVPANLLTGAFVVWLTLRSGVPADAITGPRSWTGLRVGMAVGALTAVGIVAAASLEMAGDLFADDRVLGVGVVGLLFHTLVRIPIGTALFEEVAFRGVLPALGRRVMTAQRADLLAAGWFGLWHLIPSTTVASGNAAALGMADGVVVAAAVAATTAVGLALAWMRRRWGLAAPILLHAIVNSAAFAVAWSRV